MADPFEGFDLRLEEIRKRIQEAWDTKRIAMDWLGMEHLVRDILRLYKDMGYDRNAAHYIIDLVDDAVAAFTKRGYAVK